MKTPISGYKEWLIWSIEHSAWWAPNSLGYTKDRESAGRYSFEEACDICHGANIAHRNTPNEAMILDESA